MEIDRTDGKGGAVTVTVTPETAEEARQLGLSGTTELCEEYGVKIGDTLKFGKSAWNKEENILRTDEFGYRG